MCSSEAAALRMGRDLRISLCDGITPAGNCDRVRATLLATHAWESRWSVCRLTQFAIRSHVGSRCFLSSVLTPSVRVDHEGTLADDFMRSHVPAMMAAVPPAQGGIQMLGTHGSFARCLARLWIHVHASVYVLEDEFARAVLHSLVRVWALLQKYRTRWILWDMASGKHFRVHRNSCSTVYVRLQDSTHLLHEGALES